MASWRSSGSSRQQAPQPLMHDHPDPPACSRCWRACLLLLTGSPPCRTHLSPSSWLQGARLRPGCDKPSQWLDPRLSPTGGHLGCSPVSGRHRAGIHGYRPAPDRQLRRIGTDHPGRSRCDLHPFLSARRTLIHGRAAISESSSRDRRSENGAGDRKSVRRSPLFLVGSHLRAMPAWQSLHPGFRQLTRPSVCCRGSFRRGQLCQVLL